MNDYNFDNIKERKKTNSLKYDFAAEKGKPTDLMPLWVADMDFETAPDIVNALNERVQHGIFGYSNPKPEYRKILETWMEKRHGWKIDTSWIFQTPGVVFGISMIIRALTKKGDAVMIQRPLYYPFFSVIEDNQRKMINNALIYVEDQNPSYKINIEDFECKIVENDVKLFILCNPHNPVGRVWTKEELTSVGEICLKHHVIVVSDEIHQDFIYKGHKHVVFADIKPEFNEITITCTSPSKTFNLAGLQLSNLIAANKELRSAIKNEINKTGYDEPNLFGMIACQAAYQNGEEWLEALKEYLEENLAFVRKFIENNLTYVKLIEPEGTYLIWLDFRAYQMSERQLDDYIINEAKLWLDSGGIFGVEGEGFQRINIATSRENLKKALIQLEKAFQKVTV